MEPCGAPAEHLRRSDAFGGLRAADVIKATDGLCRRLSSA